MPQQINVGKLVQYQIDGAWFEGRIARLHRDGEVTVGIRYALDGLRNPKGSYIGRNIRLPREALADIDSH